MARQHKPRHWIPLASGGAATVLLLAACSPGVPGESDTVGGRDSTTFNLLVNDTLDSIDPVLAMSQAGKQVTELLYDSLVRVDPETGEAAPDLAESWEFTPTSASFVIRQGVVCADGTEITAGTVARNFERWKDPATNAPLVNNYFGSPEFTVAFDDTARTVDVQMSTAMPFLGAEPSFTSLGIICDSGLEDPSVLSSESHGTSPYVLSEFVSGSHVTLERRDDYTWGPEGFDVKDLPEAVDVRVVADADTQVNLLLGGDADASILQPEQLQRLANEDGFSTQVATTSVTMMLFNERDGLPASDVAVRRALAQSLDFGEIAEVQTLGQGYAPDFVRSPNEVCVDPDAIGAAIPKGGVEVAESTLEKAGYTRGDDGYFARDGKPIEITFLGADMASGTAELVTATWEALGVKVAYDERAVSQAVDVLYSGNGWDVTFAAMSASQPTQFRPLIMGPAAPDGPNFGAVQNEDYIAAQAVASELPGLDSCSSWIEAEVALVEQADWVPAIASDLKFALPESVSFFNDGISIDPLTIRKD